jgi:hypothetical protein
MDNVRTLSAGKPVDKVQGLAYTECYPEKVRSILSD